MREVFAAPLQQRAATMNTLFGTGPAGPAAGGWPRRVVERLAAGQDEDMGSGAGPVQVGGATGDGDGRAGSHCSSASWPNEQVSVQGHCATTRSRPCSRRSEAGEVSGPTPPGAVERVQLIQQLYAAGLTSKVIHELLPCVHIGVATPSMLARLAEERDRIDERIGELTRARNRLDEVIATAQRTRLPCAVAV